tara:strand:+ start:1897 stop:3906 length:2010 start_codon:yes stop_codon:yes gene_type:complete
MAIIVGRRDASPLVSTAAPVHVPDKTPTEELAQGAKAAYLTYALGKEVVTDASKLATLGVKAFQDTPQEKQAKFDEDLKKRTEENYQKLREAKSKVEEDKRRKAEMLKNRGGYLGTISKLKSTYTDPDVDPSVFKDADELMSQGKFFEAESAYRMMASKFSDHEDKRGQEALRRAENAKNEFAFGRATSLEKAGKDAEAIEELDRLAESNPALKEEAEFRKSIISEAVAKEKQEAIYNASSWEEAQRMMRTEKFKELSPEESMRKVSADMAAAAMGPRPIAYKEVQAQALMAAAEQNPVKRNAMMMKVLSDFDKSGGVGVPIDNFWDMWTGDHIVKARQSIINQFKITPTQAAKIMTEISTQAKNVAMASESGERMRLMPTEAATRQKLASARMRASNAAARRARTAAEELKMRKEVSDANQKVLDTNFRNLTTEQKANMTFRERAAAAKIFKEESMASYYENLRNKDANGQYIKRRTQNKLQDLKLKRAEVLGVLKRYRDNGVVLSKNWQNDITSGDLKPADLKSGFLDKLKAMKGTGYGLSEKEIEDGKSQYNTGKRMRVFSNAEKHIRILAGLEEAIKHLEMIDKVDWGKVDDKAPGVGDKLGSMLVDRLTKGADPKGLLEFVEGVLPGQAQDIANDLISLVQTGSVVPRTGKLQIMKNTAQGVGK